MVVDPDDRHLRIEHEDLFVGRPQRVDAPSMCPSAPRSTPIEASSTSVARPPHTEPDPLTTVVTSPSVVIVPVQLPSEAPSGAGDEQAATAASSAATIE
ncbi:MAG TPA: hypothetical protein VGD06_12575 [Acidobacteriota bacterium]